MSASSPTAAGAAPDPARPALVRRLFGIDRRSLAAFRVLFGLLLVGEAFKRSLGFRAHYTEDGVLPLHVLREFLPDPLIFQAFLWSENTLYVGALLLAMGVLGVLVMVGWHAQLAVMLYLWLQVSIWLRNPFANHTGDDYLTAVLVFTCFLPLSYTYSLARRSRPGLPVLRPIHLSVGTAAMLLQIAAFYVGAGVDKHHFDVWNDGEAVQYFALIDQYTTPIGAMLIDYPGLCRFATYFTLALEIGGPLLLFSPVWTAPIRVVVVILFVGFHLGIQAVVYIGIFEMVSVAAALLFLPGSFWDLLGRARFLRPWGARLARFDAQSPGAPTYSSRSPGQLAAQGLAAAAVAIVLYSNTYHGFTRRGAPLPLRPLNKVAKVLKLKQSWQIFSALNEPKYGWFLPLGRRAGGSLRELREDGSLVNLWNGRDFDGYGKPEGFAGDFPCHNWRRYWNNIRFEDRAFLRPYLADWLIRRWNADHPDDPVDGVVILWIDSKADLDARENREALIVYEAEQGSLAAHWYLPPTPFGRSISH